MKGKAKWPHCNLFYHIPENLGYSPATDSDEWTKNKDYRNFKSSLERYICGYVVGEANNTLNTQCTT